MKVVLSYSAKDYNLAFSAASLLLEKTTMPPEKLIMYGSNYGPPPPERLMKHIGRYIQPFEDAPKYPLGPNMMAAYLFTLMQKEAWDEPVFMCEPDGFPLCEDWYDRVKDEHERLGTLVSGSWVGWVDPPHYNGNMIVHPKLADLHPCLKRVTYEAWDVFHAEFFASVGAHNKEIHNPRRTIPYYPTKWYFAQTTDEGYKPSWIHGCQNFQAWEKIEKGFDENTNKQPEESRQDAQ